VNKFDLKTALSPSILLIFSALLLSNLSDQYLSHEVELLISSKDGLGNMIFLWGGLSIASAIFFPLLVSLLCAYTLIKPHGDVQNYFKNNFELSLVETLRAWGKTFLWCFVFIIPGLLRYINYFLTPFVVAFSGRYKRGEVDALEYSTLIAKKFYWSIKWWMGVFFVIVPAIMYWAFDENRQFAAHPVWATLLTGLETYIELLFHFLILKLFINELNRIEVQDGTHV
jgi:hypothetical protein